MKVLFINLLLSISLSAAAQSSPLRTRIVNDDQTLSIQIDGFKNGRKIHYNRTFDVARLNPLQKEILKYRAFESQGIALPLHEMVWLIFAALGLPAGVAALLIGRSPAKKAALTNPVNSLRSE